MIMATLLGTPTLIDEAPKPPDISDDEPFAELVRKLSFYFVDAIEAPYTFEQLRTVAASRRLDPLINYISEEVHHRAIVSALL